MIAYSFTHSDYGTLLSDRCNGGVVRFANRRWIAATRLS